MFTYELLILCCTAFAAGFIDSIVGGGGLIQTPAVLILLPNYPIATLLGTTKIPSFAGTAIAAWQYTRRVSLNIKLITAIAAISFLSSITGAYCVSIIPNNVLKPIILVILIGVVIYVYTKKNFGMLDALTIDPKKAIFRGVISGLLIGFYDGFIGPGTGSFLIMVFIVLLGNDFLHANASAKLINLATNLAAIIYFSSTGHILWHYAIPMAVCNIVGAYTGSKLALLKGNSFIRVFFLIVVIGTIIRFAYDTFLK